MYHLKYIVVVLDMKYNPKHKESLVNGDHHWNNDQT